MKWDQTPQDTTSQLTRTECSRREELQQTSGCRNVTSRRGPVEDTRCTFALTFIHQQVGTSSRLNLSKQSSVPQRQTTPFEGGRRVPAWLTLTRKEAAPAWSEENHGNSHRDKLFYFYHLFSCSEVKCLHPLVKNMCITAVLSSSDFYNSCFPCWNEWNTCYPVIKSHS